MVVNMHEAKSRLSELVKLAREGKRVVVARNGVPVADIVPHTTEPRVRVGGQWRGRVRISNDFDAPMPEVEDLFGT
jgi:prevent-host-death family protein